MSRQATVNNFFVVPVRKFDVGNWGVYVFMRYREESFKRIGFSGTSFIGAIVTYNGHALFRYESPMTDYNFAVADIDGYQALEPTLAKKMVKLYGRDVVSAAIRGARKQQQVLVRRLLAGDK